MDEIQDPQLAASLFVIQFVVVGSVMLGAFVSRYWNHRAVTFSFRTDDSERARSGMLDVGILAVWLIATLAPLTFTALNLSGWSTIGFNPPELSVRSACAWALWLNLLFASWFVSRSGGWSDSPFTSVLVAVPTFAILLGEPVPRVLWYIFYTAALSAFLLGLNAAMGFSGTQNPKDRRRLNAANWLLSSSMLGLTAWIGMFGASR
jgi:hypothetical protein